MAHATEVDLALLKGLVALHCPVLHLHPSDSFLPSTAEFFLEHSALRAGRIWHEGEAEPLSQYGELDGWGLLECQRGQAAGTPLLLALDPDFRRGADEAELPRVPFYVVPKVVQTCPTTRAPEVLELSYVTLFPRNGPYLLGCGAHDGDWEHLTVRCRCPSGELLGVWYNAHRSRDGEWVAAEKVPRRRDSGRILAYVARHGHGTYPRVRGRGRRAGGRCPALRAWGGPATEAGRPPRGEREILVWGAAMLRALRPARRGQMRRTARAMLPGLSFGAPLPPLPMPTNPAPGCTQVGTIPRLFGFGNDHTSDRGPVWDPERVVLLPYSGDPEPSRPLEGPSPPEPATWRLQVCPSRGSTLPEPDPGTPRSMLLGRDMQTLVVTDQPCPWIWFRGAWGQTDAPATQSWFGSAECPVSRTPLMRLCCQAAPETVSV